MRKLSCCYVILTIVASMLLFPVISSALATDFLGQSSITTNSVLVGDTNEWLQKALPNCTGTGQSLQYDTTAKTFSCRALEQTKCMTIESPVDADNLLFFRTAKRVVLYLKNLHRTLLFFYKINGALHEDS